MINDLLKELRYSLGIMPKGEVVRELLPDREAMIMKLPPVARDRIRNIVYKTDQLSTVADLPTFFTLTQNLAKEMEDVAKRYGPEELGSDLHQKISYIAGVDSMGYRPAGSRAFKYFINPFAVYSFYAENHWSTKACIDLLCTEVQTDGFSLIHSPEVRPERKAEVEAILKQLNVFDLRVSLLRHYAVYGNALVLPHYGFGPFANNLQRLEVMVMDRMMPVWDKSFETIIAWDHWQGYISTVYGKDQLLHLRAPSLKMPDLGLPPLAPMVVDIESDQAASAMNSTVMHKAGMIGVLVSLETPGADNPANSRDSTRLTKRLQKEIQFQFSGLKGGQSVLVANYIKNVHKLSQIGEFDGNFMKFRQEVAKGVCICLGVPSEKIGVSRQQGLQYVPTLIEDSVNAQFDKTIAAFMAIIDRFINERILKEILGIYDFEIEANGRYGSLTLNGARAGLTASQTGALFTVNEYRRIFYGLPALPIWDKRGHEICDNSKNRDNGSSPIRIAQVDPTDAYNARDPNEDAVSEDESDDDEDSVEENEDDNREEEKNQNKE